MGTAGRILEFYHEILIARHIGPVLILPAHLAVLTGLEGVGLLVVSALREERGADVLCRKGEEGGAHSVGHAQLLSRRIGIGGRDRRVTSAECHHHTVVDAHHIGGIDGILSQRRHLTGMTVAEGGCQSDGAISAYGQFERLSRGSEGSSRLRHLRLFLIVSVGPVHLIIVGIPVHTGLAAGFLQSAKGGHHGAVLQQLVDINQTACARKRHRDIAEVVETSLIGLTPLRGGACGPRAVVRLHPVAVLIVVASALLLRTPVHLGDDDGGKVHDGHLFMELTNLILRTWCVVTAAVPATVVVYGIADVVALDGVRGITRVVGLPTRARHPDHALEAVRTDLVDDGLEEVVQSLRVILALGILQRHRLVGQFNADLSGILLDGIVLCEDIPDVQQILVIGIAHLQTAGAHARRTNHHIHAVVHRPLGQGEVERPQESLQTRGTEAGDVGLTALLAVALPVGVVGPGRIHVQTEHVAMGLLQADEEFLEVFRTVLHAGIIVVVPPALSP